MPVKSNSLSSLTSHEKSAGFAQRVAEIDLRTEVGVPAGARVEREPRERGQHSAVGNRAARQQHAAGNRTGEISIALRSALYEIAGSGPSMPSSSASTEPPIESSRLPIHSSAESGCFKAGGHDRRRRRRSTPMHATIGEAGTAHAGLRFVVQADVAGNEREAEFARRGAETVDRADQLAVLLRPCAGFRSSDSPLTRSAARRRRRRAAPLRARQFASICAHRCARSAGCPRPRPPCRDAIRVLAQARRHRPFRARERSRRERPNRTCGRAELARTNVAVREHFRKAAPRRRRPEARRAAGSCRTISTYGKSSLIEPVRKSMGTSITTFRRRGAARIAARRSCGR